MITNLLRKAHQKIKKSNIHRHKLVAFACSGKRIVTSAVNLAGEGAVSDFSIHAEEALVRKLEKIKARERMGRLSVIIFRIKNSEFFFARPCSDCSRLLRRYGIEDVYFTNNSGSIVRD